MTNTEVVKAAPSLGAPRHSHREWDGSVRETRALDMPQLSYRDGKLTDIDTDWRVANVRYGDLPVYDIEPEHLIRRLLADNGDQALIGLGSLLFVKLAINTGGFFDEQTGRFATLHANEDLRGLAVFMPGGFDNLIPDMKPFTWPKTR